MSKASPSRIFFLVFSQPLSPWIWQLLMINSMFLVLVIRIWPQKHNQNLHCCTKALHCKNTPIHSSIFNTIALVRVFIFIVFNLFFAGKLCQNLNQQFRFITNKCTLVLEVCPSRWIFCCGWINCKLLSWRRRTSCIAEVLFFANCQCWHLIRGFFVNAQKLSDWL